MIGIETEEFFCYAVVSRLGHVGVYDGRLNLLRSYVLPLSRCPDDPTTVARTTVRQRRNVWINDATYMPDAQFVTVAASDGSVHFVDTVCLVHVPTFCIAGKDETIPQVSLARSPVRPLVRTAVGERQIFQK